MSRLIPTVIQMLCFWLLAGVCLGCSDHEETGVIILDAGVIDLAMMDTTLDLADLGDMSDTALNETAAMISWTPTLPETMPSRACGEPLDLGPSVTAPRDETSLAEQLAIKAARFERVSGRRVDVSRRREDVQGDFVRYQG